MDINNDLQQINTFVKGMNTDVSDALIDSSQYRYAENVRLATNTEENTGELRLIEGTNIYALLHDDYGKILAMTSIRNMLVVITKKGNQSFILVKKINNPDDLNFILIYLSEDDADAVFGDHISLVTRWENRNDIKLYIADGKHDICYINLANGFKEDSESLIGVDSIKSNVNVTLYPITATLSKHGGNLPPVKVQYAYRLYKEGGAATGMSPLSNPVTLYDDTKGYNYVTEYTNKAVDVQIEGLADSNLSYLLIYRLSYKQVGHLPEINLIYEGGFVSSYIDSGINIESKSFEEFISMFDYNIKPQIIESKGDYLFAANVSYELDDVDADLPDDSEFRITSTGDFDSDGNLLSYNKQFDNDQIRVYDKKYWIKRDSVTNEIGGSSLYIDWTLNIKYYYCTKDNSKYEDFDEATGILSNKTYDQLSSLRQGEVYRYGAIFYDEKGAKSSVKWLCDIMSPVLSYDDGFRTYLTQDGSVVYRIPRIGVTFNVKLIPDGFEAVEIVRCDRTNLDKITYVLAIAGFPYRVWKRENKKYSEDEPEAGWNDALVLCAPYIISTNKFVIHSGDANSEANTTKAESINTKMVLACPEYVYLPTDILNLLDNKQLSIRQSRILYKSAELVSFTNDLPWLVPGATDVNNAMYDLQNTLYKISENSNYWGVVNKEGVWEWLYGLAAGFYTIFDNPDSGWKSPLIKRKNTDIPNISVYDISYNVSSTNDDNVQAVHGISFTMSPKSNTFTDNKTPNYVNSSVNLSGWLYINWSVPTLYGAYSDIVLDVYGKSDRMCEDITHCRGFWPIYGPSGSTGRYILIDLGQNKFDFDGAQDLIYALEVNVRNENARPYGGINTISTSLYMSHGNYIKGLGPLEVFDGDCYPGVFEFNVTHSWFSPEIITVENLMYNGVRQASVCYAPIESDIDLSATYGDLYSRMNSSVNYYFLDIEDSFDGFTQSQEAYLYNTAYGISLNDIKYTTVYYSSVSDNEYDTRVYHSNLKTNGETIDNWLFFSPNNYIDVDSRFGQITNMRLFKDKLLFWQKHATGILSVNERTILNDLENNDIVVGTGGTLQRYDYISTVYGMKPYQYEAEIQSNVAQYWWDGYNKEILAYGGGMELVPLTKTKGVTNYINQREESNHPTLIYDTKYDEVLAQVVQNDTLVYDEQIQAFSSVYTFIPLYRAYIDSDLYLANDTLIYKWNYESDGYSLLFNTPAFPKIRIVVNKNNIYTKTFDNLIFGGRMYKGSLPTIVNWPMERVPGEYIKGEHLNSPMHHLMFTFETPLKQKSSIRGDKTTSVDEYDYRLSIPRNGSQDKDIEYGNRMRGKTMQCEIASDYNSTDFSLQYITTKFRMSWS